MHIAHCQIHWGALGSSGELFHICLSVYLSRNIEIQKYRKTEIRISVFPYLCISVLLSTALNNSDKHFLWLTWSKNHPEKGNFL